MTPSEVERHKASDAFRGVASLPTLQLSSRKSTAGPTGADGSDGGGAGDFRGSWQLSSSRGQDEFLRALGVGPLKRKLAASHRSVQAWERLPSGEWTFTVDTPHGPKTEHLAVGACAARAPGEARERGRYAARAAGRQSTAPPPAPRSRARARHACGRRRRRRRGQTGR